MSVKKRARRGLAVQVLLGIIAAAGVLSVAATLPNALLLFGHLGILKGSRNNRKICYIRKTLLNLERNHYIVTTQRTPAGAGTMRLTPAGECLLAKHRIRQWTIPRQEKWDGKWRAVSFDIAMHKNKIRDELRGDLRRLGFMRLHQSLWVIPYPCEDCINALAQGFSLADEIMYMNIEKIKDDRELRKRFRLSR